MGAFKDLTGQQFGRWTALKYIKGKGWLCECSCKDHTRKIIHSNSLRNNLSKSCGCLRREVNSVDKLDNLTGKTFGEWRVLEYKGSSKWLCECSCKKKKIVGSQALKEGLSASCGHNTTGFKDLTGQMFGFWKAIEYRSNGYWLCKCTRCNKKIKEVLRYNLVSGASQSCGCTKGLHKFIDITNQTFGELTARKYIGGNKWLCECSCGNKSINYSHNLRRSDTISCGCKELKPYTKEEIISKIDEYTQKNGELPFAEDLCLLLDRAITSVRRYIERYNLDAYINRSFRSKPERDICKLFPTTLKNIRSIINGYELDLYYPEKKIAIEFNGSYWHSELYKDKYYHQDKTIACARKGIRLIHIFEYEWDDLEKREKIINMLSGVLNNTENIIHARNTKVKEISNTESSSFLDDYHIQGSVSSSVKLGCFYEDELIGVMTFGKPRFNNNYEYELIRLCWKPNIVVVGGAEKLFQYFIRNYSPQLIITYTDISKFTGNVYTRLGFKPIEPNPITEPNYTWWKSGGNVAMSRYQTQKHRLIKLGLGTEEQTEDEIMIKHGFVRIYDSGNLKLEWTKNQA